MKKKWITLSLFACIVFLPTNKSNAQIPILDIIKEAVTKVIVAVDLQIQRLQNETIWLQNAQKTLENEMSKLKLEEISEWVEKQRQLYDDYFQELWKVKAALSYYYRVKEIIELQARIAGEYRTAWNLFRQDKNFTPDELQTIYKTYIGITEQSLKNMDLLFMVINSFATQMSDAKRLELINTVSDQVAQNMIDLREFNHQNKMISFQRAAERGEIEYVKRLYGIR
jgi:hypothetical protein